MKKLLFLSCLLVLGSINLIFAQKKSWGVGIRLGEPSGISIKKYLGKNALELNVGRAYWGSWGNKYYNYYNYEGNAIAV
jgi:hypothetical protein